METTEHLATSRPGAGRRVRRAALAVALVAVVAHLGWGGGGVWSFRPLNYDDPQVLELARQKSVHDILTEPTWYAYKPVYFLSIKVDTLFGDAESGVAHVENLLFHALACFLLVWLLQGLFRSLALATVAGLLLAVHPVHVESVAWLSGRKDVLSLVFVLGAHLAYRSARAEARIPLLAPLLLLLGGLTKGTVWIWAGVLVLDEVVESWRGGVPPAARGFRRAAVRLAPVLLIAAGGVLLDAMIAVKAGPGAVEHGVSTASLAAAMAAVHFRYLGHLLAPLSLSLDYGIDPGGSWASLASWAGLALLLAFVVLAVVSWRRRWGIGLLAAGLWGLGLLPVNNLWPRTATLMADRYLYVPAIGLYVLVAAWLSRGRWRWFAGAIAVVLAVLAVLRTADFRDARTVWADATEKVPGSALAWFQRGQDATTREEWGLARSSAERAIALAPRPEILVKARLLEAGAMLGALTSTESRGGHVERARVEEAYEAANRAETLADALEGLPLVKQDPAEVRSEARVLRGTALERLRDPAAAEEAYEEACRIWPKNATAHYDAATLEAASGVHEDLGQAEIHLREALRWRPDFLDARIQLATVLAMEGRAEEALRTLAEAEERHGRTPDLLFAEAQVHLASKHDVQKAEDLLREIQRLSPDDPKASRLLSDIHLARGRILLEKGRARHDSKMLRQALDRFDEALKVRKDAWQADLGAGDALVEMGLYREARTRYLAAFEASDRLPWIDQLVARTGVLEAAFRARFAEDDADREEAARLAATAVSRPVRTIDFGFLPLGPELPLLRRVAARLTAGGEAARLAGHVLRGAVLAATGSEPDAARELAAVRVALAPGGTPGPAADHGAALEQSESDTLDAALLLGASLEDRSADTDHARRDYRTLVDRRPDDPLPRLRLLELDLREARIKLDLAKGAVDPGDELKQAAGKFQEATDAVRAFADAHPDVLEAGLLAVEADMRSQEWIRAIRTLNGLKERFAGEPSVYRGQAAVYVAEYLATQNPDLLKEALRVLRVALTLDPREIRTSLDAAKAARIAGHFDRALEYARRAAGYELIPGGPASRELAQLQIALARQALERGQGQEALQGARAARQVDPGGAASWLLEGDVLLKAHRFDEAMEAYTKAKELEPLNPAVDKGLAGVHRERAKIVRLQEYGVRLPTHPRTADPKAWAALDAKARAAAEKKWQDERIGAERRLQGFQAQEVRELEAALRLDPDAKESAEVKKRLGELRGTGLEARREGLRRAEEHYEAGRKLFDAGQVAEALVEFRKATDAYGDHLPAQTYTALSDYALLQAPPGSTPEEQALEAKLWIEAYQALAAADSLDPLDRYPERHRIRGELHELEWQRKQTAESKVSAIRAYERYVRAMESAGRGDEESVGLVRQRLKKLER